MVTHICIKRVGTVDFTPTFQNATLTLFQSGWMNAKTHRHTLLFCNCNVTRRSVYVRMYGRRLGSAIRDSAVDILLYDECRHMCARARGTASITCRSANKLRGSFRFYLATVEKDTFSGGWGRG